MMNTPKHTPGPWIVDGVYTIRGPKRCVVAKLIDSKEPYETKVANGHMLAAAPAMYEALKGMVSMYDSLNKSNKHDGACPCYHCQARATLAQAEGRG